MIKISRHTSLEGPQPALGGVLWLTAVFAGIISAGMQAYEGILFSLIAFIVGYFLIFAVKCVVFHEDTRSLHIYLDYFVKRIGDYYPTDNYDAVQILYKIGKPAQKHIGLVDTTYKKTQSKHFDVYLTSADGNSLLIKEFIDKNKAADFAKNLSDTIDLQQVKAERIFE